MWSKELRETVCVINSPDEMPLRSFKDERITEPAKDSDQNQTDDKTAHHAAVTSTGVSKTRIDGISERPNGEGAMDFGPSVETYKNHQSFESNRQRTTLPRQLSRKSKPCRSFADLPQSTQGPK